MSAAQLHIFMKEPSGGAQNQGFGPFIKAEASLWFTHMRISVAPICMAPRLSTSYRLMFLRTLRRSATHLAQPCNAIRQLQSYTGQV